jgi:DNA modification methylase
MIVPINKIKPNPKNPRTIKDDRFEKLKKSIQDFPDMLNKRPLVCFTDTDGKFVVLGGNMRLKAAKDLGLKELPIILADEWTEEQKAEFLIKDNVGFGEWDWNELNTDWDTEQLEGWGLEVPDFKAEVLDAEEDDYEAPEGGIETDIVLGDLFEIGEHRLLCGDSTDSDQVARLMDGKKADMVFTDPPYNVSIGTIKHPKVKQREIENDSMSKDEFKDFCRGWANCISLFCDGIIYCWAGQGEDGRVMFTILDETFHNSTTIIWAKDQFTLGRGKYHCQYEPCWFGWNKNGTTFTDDRTLSNLWNFKRPQKSELHPTMKPIELCENGLKHSSKIGSIVLDLFLGSGSTMVASHQLKRKCYGMELDPKYCQVIIDRMIKLDPTLQIKRNGQPYKTGE